MLTQAGREVWVLLVVATAAVLASASCGGGPAEEEARPRVAEMEKTVESPPAVDTKGTPLTTGAGAAGLQGRALSRSDVSGIRDSALTAGAVLFVPDARAGELLSAAGLDPSQPARARRVSFSVEESFMTALGGVVANLDAEGGFRLDLRPGRYLVCLADSFAGHTPGPPYSIVGCDRAEVVDGRALTVYFGEGGVETEVD